MSILEVKNDIQLYYKGEKVGYLTCKKQTIKEIELLLTQVSLPNLNTNVHKVYIIDGQEYSEFSIIPIQSIINEYFNIKKMSVKTYLIYYLMRFELIRRLKRDFKFDNETLSEIFLIHRTSVYYNIKKAQEYYDYKDPKFLEAYNIVEKHYDKMKDKIKNLVEKWQK